MRTRANDNFQSGMGSGVAAHLLDEILASPDAEYLATHDGFATNHSGPTPAGPLSGDRQAALLRAMPLSDLLHLSGYQTVFHSEALTISDIRKPDLSTGTTAACHAELVVTNLNYARVYAHGHNLKAFIMLRQFDAGSVMVRRIGLPVETKLTVATDPEKRTEQAFVADLESAFRANILLFAGKIAATP